MGETVRVLATRTRGPWWRVENHDDGYRGWVRAWGIVPASGRRVAAWRGRARARVVRPYAEARSEPGAGALLSPLFWNGRVIPGIRRGRWARVELPDGRKGWVERSALAIDARPPSLVRRLRGLLGVPYLWGGRTPLGFDCSGLIQQLFAERGLMLPRDAEAQFRSARRIAAREPLRTGDLVFFGPRRKPVAHVGVLLGGGYYAHARGWVRVNSLDRNNPLCDKGLLAQIRGFGRPGSRV